MSSSNLHGNVPKTLEAWWNTALANPEVSTGLNPNELSNLKALFETGTWGYREVLLTVLVAMKHAPAYRASIDFYGCSPRAVYEKGVRPFLRSKGVPCNQSGVLNVAKAVEKLDAVWAAKRRDSWAAEAMLSLINSAESGGAEKVERIACSALAKFALEASEVRDTTPKPPTGLSGLALSKLFNELIDKVVDSGNTAQTICSALIQVSNPIGRVLGYGESASTTNKTSRKPGDIVIFDDQGRAKKVYEVTQKAFSEQRISECLESLDSYNRDSSPDNLVTEVDVIAPSRFFPTELTQNLVDTDQLRAVTISGVTFQFFPLDLWIEASIFSLSAEARMRALELVHDYIAKPETSRELRLLYKEKLQQMGLESNVGERS